MLTQEQQSLVQRYDRYPAFVLSKLPRVMLEHAKRRGTEEEDVLQAGFVGLAKAALHYDPSFGVSFGTYAFTCVRRHLLHELRACLIHVPKRDKRRDRMTFDYQTLDERALGYVRFGDMGKLSPPGGRYSGDKSAEDGRDAVSWYARVRADDPSVRIDIEEALATLPERWATVVRLHTEGHSFREICRTMGVSHQRVRQIYLSALRLLRQRFGVEQEAAA